MFRYCVEWEVFQSMTIKANKWLSLEELKFLVHCRLLDIADDVRIPEAMPLADCTADTIARVIVIFD